ncbi:MAG TPA: 5-deoxy-glucuronate isomerase, partial [Acidisoma sp.]|nr:5-deoxy-glucuronate isomerase [Acidisoma sp.]
MASKLLLHPQAPDRDGFIHHVTPASAGWSYVGFSVLQLPPQKVVSRPTEGNEVCLVILSGRVRISAGDVDFGLLGARESVFDGPPWSVYIPAHSDWTVEAETPAEVAVCAAPAEGKLPARIIPPDE